MNMETTKSTNLRLVLKNDKDETVYCIISKEADRKTELEKVFSIKRGYGFTVEYYDTCIEIVDYFAGETRATFKILDQEDTTDEVVYQVKKCEE